MMKTFYITFGVCFTGLIGCQSQPIPEPTSQNPSAPSVASKPIHTASGVTITPYDREEIKRQNLNNSDIKSKQ